MQQRLFRLRNTVKKYAWGSPDWIPALLGEPNPSSEPWAELWMGAHPTSSSIARTSGGEIALNELIAADPARTIGERAAAEFGGLPFLFKLLAAARPLSIQAHPTLSQARTGWDRENAAGIPLDAPNRNYKDANHKPEILCALTPFRAMCGFRAVGQVKALLDTLSVPELERARRSLDSADEATALRAFLDALFALEDDERTEMGAEVARRAEELARRAGTDNRVWEMVLAFAGEYPRDPAIVSPLYLNVLDLEPGEAVFLPAGVLHAYVRGLGVELMANSDNVLRGGLTPKFVDREELSRTLRFAAFLPEVLRPAGDGDFARYATPAREFFLARAASTGGSVPLGRGDRTAAPAPRIVVVTEGSAALVEAGGERIALARGESAFVSAEARSPALEGTFTAFIASVDGAEGNGSV